MRVSYMFCIAMTSFEYESLGSHETMTSLW